MMRKNIFEVSEEEKIRIIGLHESATKKQYLIKEQGNENQSGTPSFTLCGYDIFMKNGVPYSYIDDSGTQAQIPTSSEIGGQWTGNRRNKKFVANQLTLNGINAGNLFSTSSQCSPGRVSGAMQTKTGDGGVLYDIVYFDESKKVPRYAKVGFDGKFNAGYAGEEVDSGNEGTVLFQQKRSGEYYVDLSPMMDGRPYSKPQQVTNNGGGGEETISLDITEPFEFDSTNLTAAAKPKFYKFLNDLNTNLNLYDGPVDIITSASIDGDPNEKLKNGMIRKDYDFDLSKRRADFIVNELNTKLRTNGRPAGFKLIPKPMGQTDTFDVGKKWPEVKDNTKTSGNRKLVIKLPTKKVSKGYKFNV